MFLITKLNKTKMSPFLRQRAIAFLQSSNMQSPYQYKLHMDQVPVKCTAVLLPVMKEGKLRIRLPITSKKTRCGGSAAGKIF